MKTPEEFEPLGLWMGWEKKFIRGHGNRVWYWLTAPAQEVAAKTSLTDAEAVEALRRLVEKGYRPVMAYNPLAKKWSLDVYQVTTGCEKVGFAWQPTIAAAVEEALLRLIAAEGGKE